MDILIIALVVIPLLILIAYSIIKAAVRNGIIEAYIRLRREGIYPPSAVGAQGFNAAPAQYWPGSGGYPQPGR